jgi:hypothetical protein
MRSMAFTSALATGKRAEPGERVWRPRWLLNEADTTILFVVLGSLGELNVNDDP